MAWVYWLGHNDCTSNTGEGNILNVASPWVATSVALSAYTYSYKEYSFLILQAYIAREGSSLYTVVFLCSLYSITTDLWILPQ